jgi:hypothetical protein
MFAVSLGQLKRFWFEFGELNSSKMRQGAGLARMNASRGKTDKHIPKLAIPGAA